MRKIVPKLRFKEFNDIWKKRKLSDFSLKVTNKNKKFLIKNVISNSAQYGLIPQKEFFDKDIANDENIDNYYIIENGDFVYNPRKSTEAPYGPINMYSYLEKGVISPLYLCFKVSSINKEFLLKYFKTTHWHKYVYENGDSGARHDRVSIKDNIFFELPIFVPSISEQEKISELLILLDKKIELQQEKIENLKLYSERIKKKLLKQDYRFREFKQKWENNYIENICKVQTGKSNTQDKCDNGIYPFYIRSEKMEKSNKYIFDCEAVLTIGDGNIGKVFFYENGKFDCHQRVYVLNNIKIYGKYLYYYFSTFFYKRAMSMSAKNTVDSVRQDMITKMSISIPIKEEQVKISKFLELIDRKIKLSEENLNKLNQYKKYLLKNMFI